MAVMQVPQFPARQPKSMETPFASANSSRFPISGSQAQLLPDLMNFTSMAAASAGLISGAFWTFLTVAGPNAS